MSGWGLRLQIASEDARSGFDQAELAVDLPLRIYSALGTFLVGGTHGKAAQGARPAAIQGFNAGTSEFGDQTLQSSISQSPNLGSHRRRRTFKTQCSWQQVQS